MGEREKVGCMATVPVLCPLEWRIPLSPSFVKISLSIFPCFLHFYFQMFSFDK